MDEVEAEAASVTTKFPVDEKVGTPPEPAPPSEPNQQGSGNPEMMREPLRPRLLPLPTSLGLLAMPERQRRRLRGSLQRPGLAMRRQRGSPGV